MIESQEENDCTSLRNIACCKDIDIGAAIHIDPLLEDEKYSMILKEEFNAVVVEHHLKWSPVR